MLYLGIPIPASAAPSHSRMVKKILLSVSTIGAEIGGREFPKSSAGNLPFPCEINLPKHPLNPNIDWKCLQPLKGEQENAVGDLFAYTRQTAQFSSGRVVIHFCDRMQVDLSGRNHSGRP